MGHVLPKPRPDHRADAVPDLHQRQVLRLRRLGHVFIGRPDPCIDHVRSAARKGQAGAIRRNAEFVRGRRQGRITPSVEGGMQRENPGQRAAQFIQRHIIGVDGYHFRTFIPSAYTTCSFDRQQPAHPDSLIGGGGIGLRKLTLESRAVTGFPFPNWAVWSSHVARVTVEDCIDKVSNRFDLVLLAGQRARQISGGAELTVDRDRDKNPVVALREIAEETVLPDELTEAVVAGLQRVVVDDEEAPDEMGSLAQSAEALRLTAAAPPRNTNLGADYE